MTAMLHGHASTSKALLRAFSAAKKKAPAGSRVIDAISAVVLASGAASQSENNTAAAENGGKSRRVSHARTSNTNPPPLETTATYTERARIP